MGIFSIANQHIRFAVKLACAIVLALFIGFHFQLETPRWAVLTAAIVAAGPAFAAGGEPYSGANPLSRNVCVLSGRLLAVSPRLSLLSL
ncbi:fusaric acid resistance protein FusB/ fusaricacid resistance protein FusC [Salmonella enterica subsp. enterica]|uniref:Fusaric acid resistance protein FusB/ fusaricacid resistance protein FusC n=1 Tax=Salmonella enterica I TaxID=59201 RepID=A0A3S4JC33_SALET|nr:fusaric acid resistance protein FusB/ fusaricacid resistance protein FusC [Salmonella enterica subsp. enterica]